MPKIRELGVTVVPEGFGPLGVGGGGGCGWSRAPGCSDCTFQPFSICGGTNQQQCLQGTFNPCGQFTCSDCTAQPFSICGTTPHGCLQGSVDPCGQFTCSDCTAQPFSICGTTPQGCLKGSVNPCGQFTCSDCTNQAFSICGTTPCGPATRACTVSVKQADPALTKAQIDQLKANLKQQLEALEQHEKELLPKTLEALDAREKELTAELEQLKGVRTELKKTK